MAPSRRFLVTVLALLISASFIVGGYVLSSPFVALRANALSTEQLLQEYAKKDTDADGLPDWQEELYGTDVNNPRSVDPTMTDKQAVDQGKVAPRFESEELPQERPTAEQLFNGEPGPARGSLTERFGRTFFEQYVTTGATQTLDQTQQEVIITNLLGTFAHESEAMLSSSFSASSIVRGGPATPDALNAYADAIATIFVEEDVPEAIDGPIPLMEQLVIVGNESSRSVLKKIAHHYSRMHTRLAAVSVPQGLEEAHVLLVRSTEEMSNSVGLVSTYESDPVAALGAIGVYPRATASFAEGIRGVAAMLVAQGEPASRTGAALIVRLARSTEQTP